VPEPEPRPKPTAKPPAETEPETPEAKARVRALRLLARREYSRRGVERALDRAGFAREVIVPVLDDLEGRGLVDDHRFCRLWLGTQMRLRPRSLRLLRHDLLREGVTDEVANAELARAAAETPESALAEAAARKKLRAAGSDPAKLARLLAARGFAPALVREVLRSLLGATHGPEGDEEFTDP